MSANSQTANGLLACLNTSRLVYELAGTTRSEMQFCLVSFGAEGTGNGALTSAVECVAHGKTPEISRSYAYRISYLAVSTAAAETSLPE